MTNDFISLESNRILSVPSSASLHNTLKVHMHHIRKQTNIKTSYNVVLVSESSLFFFLFHQTENKYKKVGWIEIDDVENLEESLTGLESEHDEVWLRIKTIVSLIFVSSDFAAKDANYFYQVRTHDDAGSYENPPCSIPHLITPRDISFF